MDRSYFQHLSLDATLSRTVAVYTKGFVVFNQLAILFVGIYSILWFIYMVMIHCNCIMRRQDSDNSGSEYGIKLVITLLLVWVGVVSNGAYVHAVGNIYLQRKVTFTTCIQVGIKHAGTTMPASLLGLVGATLGLICWYFYHMARWFLGSPVIVVTRLVAAHALERIWNIVSGSWCQEYVLDNYMTLGSFFMVYDVWHLLLKINVPGTLGLICLYIPGIYLLIQWILFNPVIVVERMGSVEALKRSWTLVSGSWCYVFCTYMISGCFLVILYAVWQLLLNFSVYNAPIEIILGSISFTTIIAGPNVAITMTVIFIYLQFWEILSGSYAFTAPAGVILGSIPFTTIAGPFFAIIVTVMYINCQAEKDELNAELFACNLGQSSDGSIYGETHDSNLMDKGASIQDWGLKKQSQISKSIPFSIESREGSLDERPVDDGWTLVLSKPPTPAKPHIE